LDTKRATSATARTMVAMVSRIASASIAAGVIAVAGRASVVHAVRSAAVDRAAIRITTSIRGHRLLRRRTRITRYVVRGISC
jgi:hypothetical protein